MSQKQKWQRGKIAPKQYTNRVTLYSQSVFCHNFKITSGWWSIKTMN